VPGVAWNLIDTVVDVDGMADYNWLVDVKKFLVDIMEETKEKMHTMKNL